MALSATPEDRICFLRLCEVVIDHVPSVLRDIFKKEVSKKHQHSWTDSRQSGNWLVQREQWLKHHEKQQVMKGNTGEWDPSLLFSVLLYSSLCLFVDEIPNASLHLKGNVLVLASTATTFAQVGGKIIVDGARMCVVDILKVRGPNQLELSKPLRTKLGGKPRAYICSPRWLAIDKLRIFRNEKYGHPPIKSGATISMADLSAFIRNVEAKYSSLGVPSHRIEELKAIEKKPIAEWDVVQKLKHYEQKWQEEVSRYEYLAERVDEHDASISELESRQEVVVSQVQSSCSQIDDLRERQTQMEKEFTTRTSELDSGLQETHTRLGSFEQRQREQECKQQETEDKLAQNQATTANTQAFVKEELAKLADRSRHGSGVMIARATTVNIINIPGTASLQQLMGSTGRSCQSVTAQLQSRGNTSVIAEEGLQLLPPTVQWGRLQLDDKQKDAREEAAAKAITNEVSKSIATRGATPTSSIHKQKLKEHYDKKGLSHKIKYITKEPPKGGYQSTVFAPEMGYAKGDICGSEKQAENSAAFHALQKLGITQQ